MKFIILFIISMILTLACNKSSKSSSSGTTSVDFTKLKPDCYQAYSSSSIITTGDFSGAIGVTKTTWNDPHVLKVGANFWMYASSDDNFDHNIKIYRLISTDGISWIPNPTTPVLTKTATKFDSQAVETPSVVNFNGQYHIFWTGYSDYTDTKTFKIGHAVSSDGITFVKDATHLLAATDPSGAPNLDFNQFLVAEPAAVVFNNKIYLYFTALGANTSVGTTLQVIGLTTSADGTSWSTPVSTLLPDQAQYSRGSPDYYKGFSTPSAVAMDGKVHLYYDVVQTDSGGSLFSQVKLHHAVSSNGLNSWTQDSTQIYDRSHFSWTATEIRSPSAYLNSQKLMLWFAGHSSSSDLGIGLATCSL